MIKKDFIRIQTICLQNVVTHKTYKHNLNKQYNKINIFTWYQILEIIQLYQPTSDLNKILIQIKINNIWQYLSKSFSISINYAQKNQLFIRYKVYEKPRMLQIDKKQIETKIKECQVKFVEYQQKFDISNIDINILWASPVINDKRSRGAFSFKISCQEYIGGILDALGKSKKRAYVSSNFFNQKCLKNRNQYSIVYLICQTITIENSEGKISGKYFIGDNADGEKQQIPPKKIPAIFQNKKIELLILHTSYPYYHLPQLQKMPGIRNILVIKSTPVYQNSCTKFFLQRFMYYLLMNKSIKDSHNEAMIQVHKKYPDQQTCCCYHQHHETQCASNQPNLKLSFIRFGKHHYNKHKLQKKSKQCCCPQWKKQQYDHSQLHSLDRKFQFTKNSQKFYDKKFQFEDGNLQGDIIYKKGFETRESLLGNKKIYPQLLRIFKKPENLMKNQNYFKIFNIYNKMCGQKRVFVEHLANFLIRRKIFIINKMYELKDLQNVKLQKSLHILYTIFCDYLSIQEFQKLQAFEVNILLVSEQNLKIKLFDQTYGCQNIRPLDKFQCQNYIKAQKHLTKQLKLKVKQFCQNTYNQKYSFIYYPINFDFNQIMAAISQSNYQKDDRLNQYISWMYVLLKASFLEEYLFFMTVYINLPQKTQILIAPQVRKFQFFKRLSNCINNIQQFLKISLMHFNIVFQKLFKQIQKISLNLMLYFVKLTFSEQKHGVALFQATTDSDMSLISKLFKNIIQDCHKFKIDYKIQEFCLKINNIYILKAGLKLIKRILGSFYLYDVLQYNQQFVKLQTRKSYKLPDNRLMTQQSQQKTQQSAQHKQNIQSKQKTQKLITPKFQQPQPNININPFSSHSAKEWQQKLQKDRKSQMLIYCLILINNAIVFRKNNKIILQIDKEQQNDYYLKQNIDRFQKTSSLDRLNTLNNKQDLQDEQDKVSDDQQDRKIYKQKDFLTDPNPLTNKFIVLLLQKIKSKKPLTKISAVTHSLAIHLLLQKYCASQYQQQQQNTTPQHLKQQLLSLSKIVKYLDSSQQGYKYRIAYDLFMSLIVIKTCGGRFKIDVTTLKKMQQQHPQIFQLQQQLNQIPQDNYQIFSIFRILTKNQQSLNKLKIHFYRFLNLRKKKLKQQNIMYGYQPIIKKWQQFNNCIQHIQIYYQMGQSYLKLFNLKKICQTQLSSKQNIKYLCTYTYNLLQNLDNQLQNKLIYYSSRLLILFVANQKQCKFMIDYQKILKKCINQQQQLIKLKIQLNQKNIEMLKKYEGCKYLLICANSLADFRNNFKLGKDMTHKQVVEYLGKMFSKIQWKYLFCCTPQDIQLLPQLKKHRKFNQHITWYSYKNILIKPDNALKRAYMIIISIILSNLIQSKQNQQEYQQPIFSFLKKQSNNTKQNNKYIINKQIISIIQSQPKFYNMQLEQNYINQQYYLYYNQVIKQQYLKQIKNILKIQPLKQYNKSTLPIQRSIDCKLQIFMQNLQFYLKIQENIYNWFKFISEDIDKQNLKQNNINIYRQKQKLEYKLLEEILSDKLLKIYRSQQKMVVVIIGFSPNGKQPWVNDILQNLLFQSEEFRLENRYVNIQKKPCLISIRRKINSQMEIRN